MKHGFILGALIASGCDGVTYEIGVSIDRRLDAQLVDGRSPVPFIQRTVEVGHYEDLRDLEVWVDVRYRGADYDVAIPFHECEAVWEPDGAIVAVAMQYTIYPGTNAFLVGATSGGCTDETGGGYGFIVDREGPGNETVRFFGTLAPIR